MGPVSQQYTIDRQLYWSAANGSGTWDTGCHWRVGGPTGPLQAWCDGSDVVFVGPPGTVTIVNPVLVASLTFLSDGYVIEGNAITLDPSPPAPLPSTGEGSQVVTPGPSPGSRAEASECVTPGPAPGKASRHPATLPQSAAGIIDVGLGSATIDCEIAGGGHCQDRRRHARRWAGSIRTLSPRPSTPACCNSKTARPCRLEPRSRSTAALWTWAALRRRCHDGDPGRREHRRRRVASRHRVELYSGTVLADLSGTAGLDKLGPGTVVLAGHDTYQGGTSASAGTLVAMRDDSLPGAATGWGP